MKRYLHKLSDKKIDTLIAQKRTIGYLKDQAAIYLEEMNISGDTMVQMNHHLDDMPKDKIGAYYLQDLMAGFVQEQLNILHVTNRYLFWFEDEGKEGWTFEIEAKDSDEAYDKAYETHGPQVEGMMYQLL